MFQNNVQSFAILVEPAVFRAGKRVVRVGNRDKITGFPCSALRYLPTDIIIHMYSLVPLLHRAYTFDTYYVIQHVNNGS